MNLLLLLVVTVLLMSQSYSVGYAFVNFEDVSLFPLLFCLFLIFFLIFCNFFYYLELAYDLTDFMLLAD